VTNKEQPTLGAVAEKALADLTAKIGQELHVSDWTTITAERVRAFADATDDHQWIHVDPERAKRESPYKAAIAHGYLTLSLYPSLRGLVKADKPMWPGVKHAINYGLDKLRFPAPVPVGSKVRGRSVLKAVATVAPDTLQFTETFSVEVEGQSRPACVADVIIRLVF
jgi:acyl dehydratase